MSIAIHYTAIKPPTGTEREVFGLQVAIADWVTAYMRHARSETLTFLIGDAQESDEIRKIAATAGVDARRLALLDRRFPERNMASLATVFRPEPDTRNLLWQRQFYGNFSFCGLAHAISGTEAGDVLQDYILAPSEPGDAIVCPSHAVRDAVRAFWDHYADYLHRRFGATYKCPVQLPVIPLGVDIEKFERRATPDKRAAQRRALNIADDEIVLLWVGRLSAAIKAHPLAMFRAAELAAEKTGKKIHLVMLGYFVPAEADIQFRELAAAMCAAARVTFVAADDQRFPDGLWAAGDIFLSLVDNCQESFGLTPIEAMAAGLPRVISDWDGYRDSVTDGQDGFLIRTIQPPPGNGFDLTAQVLNGREVYGGFLAKTALTVAVDAEQAADRIAQLAQNKDLRASIIAKARARLHATYGWKQVIGRHEDLWQELAVRRRLSPHEKRVWASALPTLPDPYMMYESYAAARLAESDRVMVAASAAQMEALWANKLNTYGADSLVAPASIAALLGFIVEQGGADIAGIFTQFPALDRPALWRTLGWLLKLGIIAK
ncbi:MAG: glycosyltransferase family 4 protein [Alphaproteobacteria bacterium]|nr:glycosyltransferase family 4 protein [Alphaproteobacteria bacterium]